MSTVQTLSTDLINLVATAVLDEVDAILTQTGLAQKLVEQVDEDQAFDTLVATGILSPDGAVTMKDLLDKVDAKHKDILLNQRKPMLDALRAKYTGVAPMPTDGTSNPKEIQGG